MVGSCAKKGKMLIGRISHRKILNNGGIIRTGYGKGVVVIDSLLANSMYSEDHLVQQMCQTTRAFSKTLNNRICWSGVYNSEWTILRQVRDHDGISQLELSEYLGVEPAAISKTLSKLEQKHIIERYHMKNGRGKYISMTAAGHSLCNQLDQPVAEHRHQAFQGFSQEECEQLFVFMQRIYHNIME